MSDNILSYLLVIAFFVNEGIKRKKNHQYLLWRGESGSMVQRYRTAVSYQSIYEFHFIRIKHNSAVSLAQFFSVFRRQSRDSFVDSARCSEYNVSIEACAAVRSRKMLFLVYAKEFAIFMR